MAKMTYLPNRPQNCLGRAPVLTLLFVALCAKYGLGMKRSSVNICGTRITSEIFEGGNGMGINEGPHF